MKLKFLKVTVSSLAGKMAVDVVDLLEGKRNVNEFLLSKKLNLTINQVRNILYKLSDYGLVSFTRKKDKRKGWYTYFWTLDTEKTLALLKENTEKKISQLKHQLHSRNSKRYYICKTCNIELTEENALVNDFTCLECGQVYELSFGDSAVKDLESKIAALNSDLEMVDKELEKEKNIRLKKEERISKKLEREKKAERKLKRKINAEKRSKLKAEKLNKNLSKNSNKKIKKKKIKKPKKKLRKKPVKKKNIPGKKLNKKAVKKSKKK